MIPEDIENLDIQAAVEAMESTVQSFQKTDDITTKSNKAKKREEYIARQRKRVAQRKAKRRNQKKGEQESPPQKRKGEDPVADAPEVLPKSMKKRRVDPAI